MMDKCGRPAELTFCLAHFNRVVCITEWQVPVFSANLRKSWLDYEEI